MTQSKHVPYFGCDSGSSLIFRTLLNVTRQCPLASPVTLILLYETVMGAPLCQTTGGKAGDRAQATEQTLWDHPIMEKPNDSLQLPDYFKYLGKKRMSELLSVHPCVCVCLCVPP